MKIELLKYRTLLIIFLSIICILTVTMSITEKASADIITLGASGGEEVVISNGNYIDIFYSHTPEEVITEEPTGGEMMSTITLFGYKISYFWFILMLLFLMLFVIVTISTFIIYLKSKDRDRIKHHIIE